jgi:branched-chain amino acid transport system substrate-binding protein
MSQARFRTLLFALLPAVLLAACDQEQPKTVCTDSLGCVVIGPTEPIKIGVIQALSGKVAPLGLEQIRGLELALNAREGKVAGHAVVLQTEDDGCTSEGGANAALKVVADPQTVAIFGSTCSGAAATAAKAMSDAGLSMISGNNSAPFLTAIGGKRAPNWQPGYFRTAPNEEHSGEAAATYAYNTLGIRRAATINDNDIYTRGLTDGFARTFTNLGGTIALNAAINKGDSDMGPVLDGVAQSQAKLLFFPLFQPEGNHILAQGRKHAQLGDLVLMSDGALIEHSFLAAMGDLARGMYFVGPCPATTPRSTDLAQRYLDVFKTQPATSYYQSGFDAANLLFLAIERSANRQSDGGLVLGREALRRALYGMRHVEGVTGSLSCDPFGDCASAVFNVLRLDDPAAGVAGLQRTILYSHAPQQRPPGTAPADGPDRP